MSVPKKKLRPGEIASFKKKLAKLKKEGKLDKAIKTVDDLESGADVLDVAEDVLSIFAGVFDDDDSSDDTEEDDDTDTDDSDDDFGGGDFGGGGASSDW